MRASLWLRRCSCGPLQRSSLALSWGGGGGGWGGKSDGGGWGGKSDGGGWGGKSDGGGWGGKSDDGGWGGKKSDGGGWGGGGGRGEGGPRRGSWGGSDGGWGGAPTGASRERGRGGFGGGRGFGGGDRGFGGGDRGFGGGGRGFGGGGRGFGRARDDGAATSGWGAPPAANDEAWATAPPSFNPPVRRVDPLTLTAAECEIDGIKKLVGQRVQITGLSDDTTWHTLKDHLRQVGEVSYCKIFSGGRAMVEFITPEEAARAIMELQGSELEGSTLFMREDREDTVLINTRRKIREAREAQQRAKKDDESAKEEDAAKADGDVPRLFKKVTKKVVSEESHE
jgi:hypothetical protein